MGDLTVLKIGGSLLTDKTRDEGLRPHILDSLAEELRQCLDDGLLESIVIVHGVGSFGHPLVMRHGLHRGLVGHHQLLPMSIVQSRVNELRAALVRSLQDHGIPACLLHPSSMAVSDGGAISRFFVEPLQGFLGMGMVPVLGGDMLVDTKTGISVCSGDQLAVLIARWMHAGRLIFACDVSGVYTADPKLDSQARLLPEIDLSQLDRLPVPDESSDASGRMCGKLRSISTVADLIREGLEVCLLSMLQRGNLRALLSGAQVECTRIVSHPAQLLST
ncbi:MAG: isopentenyl phosphate kinase [Candidatus Thorarchaeota archaeon]